MSLMKTKLRQLEHYVAYWYDPEGGGYYPIGSVFALKVELVYSESAYEEAVRFRRLVDSFPHLLRGALSRLVAIPVADISSYTDSKDDRWMGRVESTIAISTSLYALPPLPDAAFKECLDGLTREMRTMFKEPSLRKSLGLQPVSLT